jgi:hypothetical protein
LRCEDDNGIIWIEMRQRYDRERGKEGEEEMMLMIFRYPHGGGRMRRSILKNYTIIPLNK